MKTTVGVIRRLQRALNALARGHGVVRLRVDGRPGPKTRAALVGFLGGRGREGERLLIRAMRALG